MDGHVVQSALVPEMTKAGDAMPAGNAIAEVTQDCIVEGTVDQPVVLRSNGAGDSSVVDWRGA